MTTRAAPGRSKQASTPTVGSKRCAVPSAGAGFQFPIRVYWEDTDAGGIVFYANYLKFMERARTEWLRALGIEQRQLREATGGMFVVSETELKYHRPARLDDQLLVTALVHQIGSASLIIGQSVLSKSEQGVLLCEGTIRIGWVDAATLRPARIPAHVSARLAGTVAGGADSMTELFKP